MGNKTTILFSINIFFISNIALIISVYMSKKVKIICDDASGQWTIKRLIPSMGLPHWELPADTITALDEFWALSAQAATLSDDVAQEGTRRQSA